MKRRFVLRGGILTLLICAMLGGGVFGQEAGNGAFGCPEGATCIETPEGTPDDFESFRWEGDVLTIEGWDGQPVRIVHEGTLIYAQKVIFHTEENWARLSGAVQVHRDDAIISAGKAELHFDDDRFYFEDEVYLQLTGEQEIEIWADVLEIHTETDDLIAQGNVKLQDADRTATAHRLEYERAADRLVLSGSVKVTEERSESEFERFVIDLNDNNFVGYGAGRIILRDL